MDVTANNAADLLNNLANVLGDSIEQVQTTENLNIVANFLESVVDLLDVGKFTVDESVRERVYCTVNSYIMPSGISTSKNIWAAWRAICIELYLKLKVFNSFRMWTYSGFYCDNNPAMVVLYVE